VGTDLKSVLAELGGGIYAHSGFLEATMALFDKVDAILSKNPTRIVIFTGHSLGGAIAHCFNMKYILQQREGTISIGFGAPLVFGQSTDEHFAKLFASRKRFITWVNNHDPVTSIQVLGENIPLVGKQPFGKYLFVVTDENNEEFKVKSAVSLIETDQVRLRLQEYVARNNSKLLEKMITSTVFYDHKMLLYLQIVSNMVSSEVHESSNFAEGLNDLDEVTMKLLKNESKCDMQLSETKLELKPEIEKVKTATIAGDVMEERDQSDYERQQSQRQSESDL
jgi:hypothetical protein